MVQQGQGGDLGVGLKGLKDGPAHVAVDAVIGDAVHHEDGFHHLGPEDVVAGRLGHYAILKVDLLRTEPCTHHADLAHPITH